MAWRLGRYTALLSDDVNKQDIIAPPRSYRRNCKCPTYFSVTLTAVTSLSTYPTNTHSLSSDDVDKEAVQQMFDEYDSAKTGFINVDDLERLLVDRGLAPTKKTSRGSSIRDKQGE